MCGQNASVGMKHEPCGEQKVSVDIWWEEKSLSIGIFLFAGTCCLHLQRTSLNTSYCSEALLHSQVYVCSNQALHLSKVEPREVRVGGTGPWLPTFLLETCERWRREKDENMVQPQGHRQHSGEPKSER